MSFNITKFGAELSSDGFSNLSHFLIRVGQPKGMLGTRYDIAEWLSYRIKSATLPGRSVRALEYFTYGPEQKIGGAGSYTDVQMQVICSSRHKERDFFLDWQDIIIGNHRKQVGYTTTMFDQGYYSNYISRVEIDVFDETGKVTKTVVLEEAYPNNIGDIQYDWGTSEHASFSVSWSYRYFYEKDIIRD
jgi:hypothetical protein